MAKLANNEANGDFTHIVTLDYTDLQTIGTGGQTTIATIPAGGAVELVGVLEETAFAGTTSLVIDIGTTAADPDEFIDALDVDAMTVPVFNTGDAFTTNYTQAVKAVASATSVLLEVTDAAIASATAGKLVIGLRILDLKRFATG
jgi:hypothetical protein